MHDESVAIDVRPCGGLFGEGLKRPGTAELVGRRAGDETQLGVASAYFRVVAFVVMDERRPGQPEAVGFGAQVDLGVTQLPDEKAIAGLNLRFAAEMPDELGD